MTAICRACGADLLADAAYCHRCGQAVSPPTALEPVTDPVDRPIEGPTSPVTAAGDDEAGTLWEGSYSAKAMLGGWLAAAVLTVAVTGAAMTVGVYQGLFLGLLTAVLCFGGICLYVMFRKLSVRYLLTSQQFIHQAGLLRRVTDRIEVIDVDDVAYYQGLVQRCAGVGTIKIMSSDRSHSELFLEGVDRVAHVASLIDAACRAERRRRGLFIESV
jgi:hypothetical protein